MTLEERLIKGTEPNLLKILVDNIETRVTAKMKNGMINAGVIVTIPQYSLENVLCQMIDEYGKERLIKEIENL